MSASDALWQSYIAQLSAAVGIEKRLFKVSTGLVAADWEVLDTTGLGPAPANQGQRLSGRIYGWGDPMPRWAPAYYAVGNSFYDMYRAFLASLKRSSATDAALQRAQQYTMTDPAEGTSFPAYTISPSLYSWYKSALQAEAGNKPPMLDFTVAADTVMRNAAPVARLAAEPPVSQGPGEGGVNMPFLTLLEPSDTNEIVGLAGGDGLSLRYTAQSLATFAVSRGGWYDSSVLAIYADQIDLSSPLAKKPLFGPDGLLNVTTANVVVALRRSVTITCSRSQIAQMRTAQGGNIGGFAFDPGQSRTAAEGGGGSFVMKDNTDTPYVIGIGVDVLGPGEQPGSILVKNNGGFYVRFSLRYQQNAQSVLNASETFDRGTSKSIPIPAGARDIVLMIEEMYLPLPEKWSTVLMTSFTQPVEKKFEVYGTTLDAKWREF
jgi:hypothetical protein